MKFSNQLFLFISQFAMVPYYKLFFFCDAIVTTNCHNSQCVPLPQSYPSYTAFPSQHLVQVKILCFHTVIRKYCFTVLYMFYFILQMMFIIYKMTVYFFLFRKFSNPGSVFLHTSKVHTPYSNDDMICQWEGCDSMKRRRFSLLTHLQVTCLFFHCIFYLIQQTTRLAFHSKYCELSSLDYCKTKHMSIC